MPPPAEPLQTQVFARLPESLHLTARIPAYKPAELIAKGKAGARITFGSSGAGSSRQRIGAA